MDLEILTQQTREIAVTVGDFIREQKNNISPTIIEKKGIHDFVTYVDKTAEKKIVEGLSKILPESGFITEEKTSTKKGAIYNWIIDPLDGTTNYIHGLSPFAVSIALMEKNEIILGVVYEINLDECFYAYKGSKAFLNEKEINVTKTEKVDNSLIATGFPYYDYDKMEAFMQTLEFFMKNSHGLRRLGSAATDLVYVACGRFDAFYEYSLHAWDVAAGAFIVKQAGGKVCDFNGKNNYLFGKEIIASNSLIHNEFLSIIKDYMYK
ncbi:MAG: inositol monophosphatase [Bacteroidetes bacterium]|nr:MAG: inositol monophosphatase [Bacteroidota bacterium]